MFDSNFVEKAKSPETRDHLIQNLVILRPVCFGLGLILVGPLLPLGLIFLLVSASMDARLKMLKLIKAMETES